MILDGLLLILCIIAFIRGWKKGLLWAIVSIIAVLIGIVISLKCAHLLADYLFENNILNNQYTLLLCFILLFLSTIFIFRMLVKFIEKILESVFLGWVNNVLGGLCYCFFILFLCSTFLWLGNKAHLIKPENKLDSKSYEYIAPLAPKTIAYITPYIPLFKTLYSDIEAYFAKLSKGQ
jgi:membrane protein required for colicin V production